MSPNSDHKQITSWLTPGQLVALKEAVALSSLNQSEYIRAAVGAMVESIGLFWPDDMPKRGTYNRKTPSK